MSMGDVLLYLKQTKHALIGNSTNKLAFRRETDSENSLSLSSIVEYVKLSPTEEGNVASSSSSLSRETQLRIEAANIIASLAHGPSEVLIDLLKVGAHSAVLAALSGLSWHDPIQLIHALARALRALNIAIADSVGPALWGLSVNYNVETEATAALDFAFQPVALNIYLPLLEGPSEQLRTTIIELIAFSVRIAKHRIAVTDWLPVDEIMKESKGKRGWEVDAHSPRRQGGWVVRHLTSLLASTKNFIVQEVLLYALATLVKENVNVANALLDLLPEKKGDPSLLTDLSMHRRTGVKLAACLCIANTVRSYPNNSHPPQGCLSTQDWKEKLSQLRNMIIMNLNSIISDTSESHENRTKACHILSMFILDDDERCKEAFESGSLLKLNDLLTEITPTVKPIQWEDGEPKSKILLREATLTALASIALFDDSIRSEISGSLNLLPIITLCVEHPYIGVRYGAVLCLRSLTRSVSVLRTSVIDSGADKILCEIIQKHDEDPRLINIAMVGICNLANNFSPIRKTIIDQGLLTRFITFVKEPDPHLKLNAIWAIKNLTYKASTDEKIIIMKLFGWDFLKECLVDSRPEIREQAVNICTNIATSEFDINLLLDHLQGPELMDLLSKALEMSSEDNTFQITSLLCNISNGSDSHRSIILNNDNLLESLNDNLLHENQNIRRAATACVEQLALTTGEYQNDVLNLKRAGIDQTLLSLSQAPSHIDPQTETKRRVDHSADEIRGRARNALSLIKEKTFRGSSMML